MKTFICTLAGEGKLTVPYVMSLMNQTMLNPARLATRELQAQYQIGHQLLWQESLVSRGRNTLAAMMLKLKDVDRLFFIDSDQAWTWPQFKAVLDACSAEDGQSIVAGVVPCKSFPVRLNFLPFEQDEKFFERPGQKTRLIDPQGLIKMSLERDTNLIEVPLVGTGFMCIDMQVFRDLTKFAEPYQYPDADTGEDVTHWDFFPTKPVRNKFQSEDWGFCELARSLGHKVFINTDVVVDHYGTYAWHVDLMAEAKKLGERENLK